MRLAYVFAAVGLACNNCLAQEACGIPKHGPSADAVAAFEKIAEAVGIRPGTILLYASSDQLVKDRSGALSVECPSGRGEERWIVYDPDLIRGDGICFALAHETAHHLNYDPMSGEAPSKQLELRADEYAARYLTRPPLNWTSEKLVQALSALPLSNDVSGLYPSVEERRAQVKAGYTSESAHLRPNPEAAPATPSPSASDIVKLNQLVIGKYDGLIRLRNKDGQYLSTAFGLTSSPTEWRPKFGRYNELGGYWIFRTDVRQAWQAENANGPLRYWNADGLARGNPEDHELFVFEAADAQSGTVYVRNVRGRYVRYAAPSFRCDADISAAVAFIIEFPAGNISALPSYTPKPQVPGFQGTVNNYGVGMNPDEECRHPSDGRPACSQWFRFNFQAFNDGTVNAPFTITNDSLNGFCGAVTLVVRDRANPPGEILGTFTSPCYCIKGKGTDTNYHERRADVQWSFKTDQAVGQRGADLYGYPVGYEGEERSFGHLFSSEKAFLVKVAEAIIR